MPGGGGGGGAIPGGGIIPVVNSLEKVDQIKHNVRKHKKLCITLMSTFELPK